MEEKFVHKNQLILAGIVGVYLLIILVAIFSYL